MGNKYLRKFISFSYGSIFGTGIAFITTLITTRILKPEEFGKASMFILFVSLSMILVVFGTDRAFVRFFYEEKEEKRGGLLYNCLKISSVILIPLIVTVILIRKIILLFLFSDYSTLIIIGLIVAIILQIIYRFGTLVVRMQQKGNTFSLLEILNKSFVLIFLILFYFLIGSTYEILIYSTIFTYAVLVLFLIFSQRNFWKPRNIKEINVVHSKKDIFTYSYPLVFTTAIMWVFEGFDMFAIRLWADLSEL